MIGISSGQGGVPALRSGLLSEAGFRHAFFTRLGGVSLPPFDTLNFLAAVGDDALAVAENRRRAAHELGIESSRLYFLSQVHGTDARALLGDEDWDSVVRSSGDITLSKAAGVGCGVRSADCVPVLIADRKSGAVCAVHSGWKGTVSRAAVAGLMALRRCIGGEGDWVAAIGPHIERCCFEVGRDVAEALSRASVLGEQAVMAGQDGANPKVDLRAIVRAQLMEAGVSGISIDDVRGCTVCDSGRFFSYRRDKEKSGRLLSAIVAGRTGA